ncbi:Tuberous sclerosis 2-like protein [Aspergillus hancockii]|nr:Tuberous sclerosis 2-like protein [Aspergillus hancockii]
MSSDDGSSPSNHKHPASSFADVFRSLGVTCSKSLSPISVLGESSDSLSQTSDGHRNSWVALGFESMHRGSVVSSSSDASGAPDFETSIRNLTQRQNLAHAIDEAEQVSKSLHWFTSEQAIALWEAGSYLIHHTTSPEARRSGSLLIEAIAARQDLSPAARRIIFESISCSSESDVVPARVLSLISLSDHGRKLEFASSSIVPIISSCIVPLYELISSARLKARKAKVAKSNGLAYDDAVLDDLLQFAVDLITLQRKPPSSEEVQSLLDQIFIVCKKTSVAADIKNSLAVFEAIIIYADVPDGSFVPMLEVLCNIYASVKSLSGPTSRTVRNLAKSRRQDEMVNTLYSFLFGSSEEYGRNLNILRGAVHVFTDLIRAHGQDGIPQLQFEQLVDSLQVVSRKDDGRLEADILDLCLNVLEGEFSHLALARDWSAFINIIVSCSLRAIGEPWECSTSSSTSQLSYPRASVLDDTRSSILANIIQIASALEALWERMDRQQKLEATRFMMNVCQHVDPPQAELVLNTMRTEKLCFPENPDWIRNCHRLTSCFVRSRTKPSDIRILALDTVKEAFTSYENLVQFQEHGLLNSMLENFSDEDDILFLESLVSFIVDISILARDEATFDFLVDTLGTPMNKDLSKDGLQSTESPTLTSPHSTSAGSILDSSLANVCSVGLVKVFLRSLNMSARKAVSVFEALLKIAQASEKPVDSRLTVLKLLFRLRCDSSGSVTVLSVPENDFLMNVPTRNVDAGPKPHISVEERTGDNSADNDNPRISTPGKPSTKETASISSKSSGRNAGIPLRTSKLTPPVWTYTSSQVLPEEPPDESSPFVYAYATSNTSHLESDPAQKVALKANMWLESVISLLHRDTNWEIYSYVLTHLAPQLRNRDFFSNAVPQTKLLRSILCDQVKNDSFREPPALTGVKKTDVAGYIFDTLCVLISYHEFFAKSEEDELVRSFMMGIIGSWGGTSRGCIHALSVCCHEIPLSVTKSLNGILDKMSKVITLANLAVHILEFLALLARLPDVYINLREEEIRTVFGICIRFLQTSREQRFKASESINRNPQVSAKLGSGVRETAALPAEMSDPSLQDGMSRYIYTLTHHVMVFWFLSLKLQDRAKHVNWITSRLIFKDEHGKEMVEEQSQVFLDLMQRVAFSDLGETIPYATFPPSPADGPVTKKSWVVGMSIITVEVAGVSGLTQITKRQASGTTYAMYQQRTAPVLPHQVPPTPDAHLHGDGMRTAILPSHVMLQLTATAFPTPTAMQPIPLPEDDIARRALNTFDRNDIVDGHKIGVIYVDNGQTSEADILSNTSGSPDYEYFLSRLGTKVPLRGAQFNTQGLHPDIDGDSTYAWRDRVTEIVYHVATIMPTNFDNDPSCVNKKRHIGNDFVNIIFNRSNIPFNFDTIPSQFNFVNIVISPACRIAGGIETTSMDSAGFENLFYHVQVMSKPSFPEISPAAAPKIISGKNLAAFVRFLALNASVFSLVWNSQGGEHISSWRNRLREIKRLRERALGSLSQNPDTAEGAYPGQRRNTKPNIFSEELPTRSAPTRSDFATDWNAAADANILQNLDFSRWGR